MIKTTFRACDDELTDMKLVSTKPAVSKVHGNRKLCPGTTVMYGIGAFGFCDVY